MDSALDKAFEKAGLSGDTSLAPVDKAPDTDASRQRDENGRFKPKSNVETYLDAVIATHQEHAETPEPKFSDEDVRKAVSAAQRVAGKDGVPKAITKAIESGDEETLAYYLKLARVQSDGDEFSKKHKTLQQELEQIKSKPAANSGDDKDKTGATASASDIEAASKPLADYLTAQLGDAEAAKPIREFVAGLTKSHALELEKRDQQAAKLQKQVEAMAIERARDALVSEYPDLKDKDVWAKVQKHLDQLPESEDRPDLMTRLEHAARIELAPELIRRAKAAQDRRDKARDNGQATPVARAGEAKAKVSVGDLHERLLEARMNGDEAGYKETLAVIKSKTQT